MSFIPIVRDILPIILPNLGVQVTKSTELDAGTSQADGMVRKAAVVHKSQHLCASVMIAHAHTSSAVHHHGEQDTIVYAASGRGVILSNNGKHRQVLEAGDFAFIPAWTEHQEVNDSDEEVTWIITRSGPSPIIVNLKGWGGPEMKS